MRTIDGRAHAAAISAQVAADVARMREGGVTPRLAVLVPTDDEATAWYVRSIGRAAASPGATSCGVSNSRISAAGRSRPLVSTYATAQLVVPRSMPTM